MCWIIWASRNRHLILPYRPKIITPWSTFCPESRVGHLWYRCFLLNQVVLCYHVDCRYWKENYHKAVEVGMIFAPPASVWYLEHTASSARLWFALEVWRRGKRIKKITRSVFFLLFFICDRVHTYQHNSSAIFLFQVGSLLHLSHPHVDSLLCSKCLLTFPER